MHPATTIKARYARVQTTQMPAQPHPTPTCPGRKSKVGGGGRSPPYCLTSTGMRRSRPNGSARTPQGSPTWLCKPAPKLRGEQPARRQTQLGHCRKADSCCKCSSMLQTICRTNPANYTSQDLQVMQAGKTWLGPLGARHSTVLKNTV